VSVRWNPVSGIPVLFAPERAERPGAFGAPDESRCPFCPGHEADTPPTILAAGSPWNVRVFANKYPPANGAEVIVESREHDATFDGIEHAEQCLKVYRDRILAHQQAAAVALFKNEGPAAGASIPHLHSQLVPLTFVPPRQERECAAFEAAARCPLCTNFVESVLFEGRAFQWIVPAASSMPYQQWIVPRRHVHDFTLLTAEELSELAALLQRATRATHRVADAYNWIFMTFPRHAKAHFYVDLLPRLTTIAGLELGTGTFVEIIDPADAAKRLRD
jgi:UDPglucose--hexose-1-phosphate uridylyltransferase